MLNAIVNAINKLTEAIKCVVIYKAVGAGFFYISASAGVTITTSGTYYPVGGTFATVSSELFSISTAGLITYNGDKAIDVMLNVSACLTSDTNGVIVSFRPALNGVTDSRLTLCRKLATRLDVGTLSGAGTFTMEPGDTAQVQITADSSGPIITFVNMLISIHSIS